MNQNSRDNADKLKYEPPIIEQSASFERLMLACTRQPGNEGQGGPCDPLENPMAVASS